MGLGPKWNCLFANDFDHKKSKIYDANWGAGVLRTKDVRQVTTADLPGFADLVWGSFPCQDLSLAGVGAGLQGARSGTFWPFWRLIDGLIDDDRAPQIVVLENVCGTLTSHSGNDFSAICSALKNSGYKYGALVIDAALFVPQSRPRLFVVAVRDGVELPDGIVQIGPSETWHSPTMEKAYAALPETVKDGWVWWSLPEPVRRNVRFADLIEDDPICVNWHTPEETSKLLSMMSPVNLEKVTQAKQSGTRMVGTIYKRTRRDENGFKVQRAEIRFDDVAGCLRTPAGGSSRQSIMIVEGESIKSRLISSRETARLMGLPDEYELPGNYNEAYHLTGDGVVVPVVRHLAEGIFEPILEYSSMGAKEAA